MGIWDIQIIACVASLSKGQPVHREPPIPPRAKSAGRDRRRVRSLTPFKTDKQSSRKEGGGRRTSARFG
jgi:hypothetical protein